MPEPVDECRRLRQRIAQLSVELKREQDLLHNEPFAAQQAVHRENIERIASQIDHERALLEEMGCDDPHIPDRPPQRSAVRIIGVEVTQAIQYHRAHAHLTDPADRGADNSVRLVANKPAWVRVYVRSNRPYPFQVTGTVEVRRLLFSGHMTLGTLSPQSPSMITAPYSEPNYGTERSSLSSTLNFIIPAAYMFGYVRLLVKVNLAFETTEVDLDATLRQTLRLAGIMVSYNGPNAAGTNITLPAPTLADLQSTAPFTLTTMPVQSNATFRIAGTIPWTTPLTDPPTNPGGCSPNWVNLNAAVQQVRISDGNRNDVIYYGLMAPGIPIGPVGGCNTGGISTGPSRAEQTMAHEIGHYLGLRHAPCNTPGDPSYPAYEPYDPAGTPMASIGEYGLNINNGQILNPQTFKDYMSYCGPGWMSLYHHGRLINNNLLDPTIVYQGVFLPWLRDYVMMDPNLIPEKWLPDPPPDPLPWRRFKVNPEPLISVIGIVHSDKEVEVQSVARVEAYRELPNATPTDLIAELVDEEGERLTVATLYRLPAHGHGGCCDGEEDRSPRPPYPFQAFLSNVAPGSALRIRHGDNEIWSRPAPTAPPSIERFHAQIDQPMLRVEWEIQATTEQEPEAWVQWSSDGGETWYALTGGLRGYHTEIDLSALPSGNVLLRLLAHDGFFTVTSDPMSVEIPLRPPTAAILNPRDGSRMEGGSPLRLWGIGTYSTGKPVEPGYVRWLINGDEVARGLDVFVTAPSEGKHSCTLIIETSREPTEVTTTFETVDVPHESRQL